MSKEMRFSLNFSSNADKVLSEFVKGVKDAKKEAEATAVSTGRGPVPRAWKSGLLPGGMSPSELYMGGMGSAASGVLRAPSGSGTGAPQPTGLLGAGLAAGAAAASFLMLGKVMKDMVQQSKIANTLQKSVNKSMGLLVDLVLLPFLPVLTFGIIQLYTAILGFNNWWQTVWNTIKKEGLFGLIKLGLDWVWGKVDEWIQNLIKWFFGPETPAQKAIDVVIGLATVAGGFFAWLGDKVIGAVIDFIFGQGTMDKVKTVTLNLALGFLGDPAGWLAYAVGYVFGATLHVLKDVLTLTLSIINGTIKSVWDFAVWIWDVLTGKTKVDVLEFIISLIPKDPTGMLWSFVKWAMAGGAGLISKFLEGGVAGYNAVPDTTSYNTATSSKASSSSAMAAAVGASSSRGATYNFYGYDDKSLQNKVKGILRQEGARYNL